MRPALRSLWRRPQFALVSIVLLALGVGANTVLFSIADAVMFRPFPFRNQDRLVIGGESVTAARSEIPYPDFIDWRTRSHSFEDLAAMGFSNWTTTMRDEDPIALSYRAVSGNFFDVLGARAALGRTLTADDDRRGSPPTLVLSHGLWQRRFGGDPHVVGRSVVLRGRTFTIVGVMPRGFTYPERPDAWAALVPAVSRFDIPGQPDFTDNRNVSVLLVIGRLRAGVGLTDARSDLDRIIHDLAVTYGRSRQMTSRLTPRMA
jgi:putative ABC transport system permease protein